MSAGVGGSVVILYEHSLLGEGIACYVRNQTGIRATVAAAYDADAVTTALAIEPSVVIYELSDPARHRELAALVPDAVLIDVSTAVTRGATVPPTAPALDQILATVCDGLDGLDGLDGTDCSASVGGTPQRRAAV